LKPQQLKQLFYFSLLLFSIACFFSACKEIGVKPNTSNNNNSNGGSDSTAKVDTLPSFYSPSGLAVDAAGNIYVADYGNNLIRKITPTGVVSTFAGSGNQGNIDAAGLLASFNRPTGIAVDASGNLFVADAGNNVIRKITADGTVSTLAGSDSTGSVNGVGVASSFFDPVGVAVDASDNVYVADAGNNMVRMISSAGAVTTLASDSTSSGIVFSNPTGVAKDAGGNVFIANYLNNNILLINPARTVSVFAGTGLPGAGNGPAGAATFYFPNSVAVDAADNVYVSDGVNNLIRKITPGGTVSTLAGSGDAGAIDSTGTAASFNGPAGLAVDAAGNVYVADANNNLIRKITPAGVVTTIAGNGEPGAKNGVAIAYRNKRRFKNIAVSRFNIFYNRKPK
jgi:sugar lactone lactonase YvrE